MQRDVQASDGRAYTLYVRLVVCVQHTARVEEYDRAFGPRFSVCIYIGYTRRLAIYGPGSRRRRLRCTGLTPLIEMAGVSCEQYVQLERLCGAERSYRCGVGLSTRPD